MTQNLYDITVKDINGNDVRLSEYEGNVLLIVNVASKCGFTPQYEGLQQIYETYNEQGFEILAFPCNQFGGQEPGTNEEIQQFCSVNYNVTFPLFDKIDVNGENRSPLYTFLTGNEETGTEDIKWNFEKFLVSKNGEIVARYKSGVEPTSDELTSAIESELSN